MLWSKTNQGEVDDCSRVQLGQPQEAWKTRQHGTEIYRRGRSKPVGSLDSGPCSGNKRVQRPGRRGVLGALIDICLLNVPLLSHLHTDKLVLSLL